MNLRKKVSVSDFFRNQPSGRKTYDRRDDRRDSRDRYSRDQPTVSSEMKALEIGAKEKEFLKEISSSISGSDRAVILDVNLKEIKTLSARGLGRSLERIADAAAVVIDGSVTGSVIQAAERIGVAVIVANNFKTTDTKIKLMSL